MATTVNSLALKNKVTLTDYVRDRLQEKRMDPPWAATHDEEPEDFIIHVCKITKSDFSDRLNQVIATLLEETEVTAENGIFISRLLDLAEYGHSRSPRSKVFLPILKKWWGERNKFVGIPSQHTRPDLLVHLIRAITDYKIPEILNDLEAYLGNPNYAPAAFRGIIDLNLNPIKHLHVFVRTLRLNHEEIWIKVALENLGRTRGTKRVIKEWKRFSSDAKKPDIQLVDKLMKEIPAFKALLP
jgi:hypothetical protein